MKDIDFQPRNEKETLGFWSAFFIFYFLSFSIKFSAKTVDILKNVIELKTFPIVPDSCSCFLQFLTFFKSTFEIMFSIKIGHLNTKVDYLVKRVNHFFFY